MFLSPPAARGMPFMPLYSGSELITGGGSPYTNPSRKKTKSLMFLLFPRVLASAVDSPGELPHGHTPAVLFAGGFLGILCVE